MSDLDAETISPVQSAKGGIVTGVTVGIAIALFQMITQFQSVLQATASVVLLAMIGALVGLVAAYPLTIGYNLVAVTLRGGIRANATPTE